MNWHDCIHRHVASHRVGCGRMVMLNSPFLVNGCDGLGNETTSKVETHCPIIGNKEINNNKKSRVLG